jgi:hypothetical protein
MSQRQANWTMPRRTVHCPRERAPSRGACFHSRPAYLSTAVARERPLIPKLAGQHLMDEHVGRLYADSHNPGQHVQHGMSPFARSALQALPPRRLNYLYLFADHPQPRQIASQLGQRAYPKLDSNAAWWCDPRDYSGFGLEPQKPTPKSAPGFHMEC